MQAGEVVGEAWQKTAERFGWLAATLMALLAFVALVIWRWMLPLINKLIDSRSEDLKGMLTALSEHRVAMAGVVTELKEHGAAIQIVGHQLQTVVHELKVLAKVTSEITALLDGDLKHRVEEILAEAGRRG